MFTLVANTIQFFIYIIHGVFIAASSIGQIIFTIVATVTATVLSIFRNIFLFWQILYEDNSFIVTEDLPNLTDNIIKTTTHQLHKCKQCLYTIFESIHFKVCDTIATFVWFLNAVFTIISEVLLLLKNTLIFIGDTLWLILTFLPLQVPLLLKFIISYLYESVKDLFVEAYLRLLKLTNFLTDVPLQSLIGITFAIIMVRLYVNYREDIHSQATVLYWFLVRRTMYLYYVLYNYFTNSEVRMIARMAPHQHIDVAENIIANEDDATEAMCVICQERQKCVLTLPCRHVCLCRDCCTRLYAYQRTCPICRTFIYHSVNIYL